MQNGNWSRAGLDDDLRPGADLCKHSREIARCIDIRNVNCCHSFDDIADSIKS
jgi:hypothetical protein